MSSLSNNLGLVCLVLVPILASSARPRLPLIEDSYSEPKRSPQTQCFFGDEKNVYDVGEQWKPTGFDCTICECFQIQRKKRLISKSICKDIVEECPKVQCEEPVLLPGRCCKTCGQNDTNIESQLAKHMFIDNLASLTKRARKHFYAVLADNFAEEKRLARLATPAENEAFMQIDGRQLNFIVSTKTNEKPTFVRFQDPNDTIIEEYVVYGNSTQSHGFTIYGVWPKVPKMFKGLMRKGLLRVALSFDNDPNADSRLSGYIRKANPKRTDQAKYFEDLISMTYRNDSKLIASMLKATATIPLEQRNNVLRAFDQNDQSNDGRGSNTLDSSHKCYIEAQIYEDGAQWKNQHDECEMCYCKRGRVKCETEKCLPPIGCASEPIRVPAQCCPVCPAVLSLAAPNQTESVKVNESTPPSNTNNTSSGNSCFFQGDEKYHLVGSRWHPFLPPRGFDKCTTCTCTSALSIECKRKKCAPLACAEHDAFLASAMDCCKRCPNAAVPTRSIIWNEGLMSADQDMSPADEQKLQLITLKAGGCKVGSLIKRNGEQWSPILVPFGEYNCVRCTCKDGKAKCRNTRIHCPDLSRCKIKINKRDECCPVCADPVPGAARRSGRRSSRAGAKLKRSHQPLKALSSLFDML